MRKITIKISIRIIAIFGVAFIMSFIADLYPKVFGDFSCTGNIYQGYDIPSVGDCQLFTYHNPKIHWAYRHYVWFFMGLVLFTIQVIDIINLINKDNEN